MLALVLLLAVLTEGILEYFMHILKVYRPEPATLKAVKPLLASLIAVALCLLYGADLLEELGFVAGLPWTGEIVTGLIAGRGSNYVNDLWKLARSFQGRPEPGNNEP